MEPNGGQSINRGIFSGQGLFVPNCDVQIFTPAVSSYNLPPGTAGVDGQWTWTRPPGVQMVLVFCVGPGGGGGSGRKGTTISVCCGGGGGASGGLSWGLFPAAELPNEMFVYVPAGSKGGAAQSTNSTNGNAGANPGSYSSFGFVANQANYYTLGLVTAVANGPGGGGTASAGSGGIVNPWGSSLSGAAGNSASTTGGAGTINNAAPTNSWGAPGSPGGGLTSANATSSGGPNPASSQMRGYVGGGGGPAATAGQSGGWPNPQGTTLDAPALLFARWIAGGTGGAGGGSSNSASAAGAGGNGATGCGGGGGGAATDTTTPNSGAGGNGGDGLVVVIAW